MIKAEDAIRTARSLIGTPYSQLDCIGLIVRVIRTAPGGVPSYRTAGTNTLWRSAEASSKYRDLTWRQEGLDGAQAGMLSFKRKSSDTHHVGLVTDDGTVVHSSSAKGCVVETPLDSSWQLLARHRYIDIADEVKNGTEETLMEAYKMVVSASSLDVRKDPSVNSMRIGRLGEGAVVTVQEEYDNGWVRVTYGDSGSGYVDGRYLVKYTETDAQDSKKVTILDSAGNSFIPVGDFRVIFGSVD